ncbi:hypothetical protein ABW19_dt0204039 [Dactylella cylindrospora]|nr:hypothetical protein ABW19_dt0204039 [Dactylella cylindrospora]
MIAENTPALTAYNLGSRQSPFHVAFKSRLGLLMEPACLLNANYPLHLEHSIKNPYQIFSELSSVIEEKKLVEGATKFGFNKFHLRTRGKKADRSSTRAFEGLSPLILLLKILPWKESEIRKNYILHIEFFAERSHYRTVVVEAVDLIEEVLQEVGDPNYQTIIEIIRVLLNCLNDEEHRKELLGSLLFSISANLGYDKHNPLLDGGLILSLARELINLGADVNFIAKFERYSSCPLSTLIRYFIDNPTPKDEDAVFGMIKELLSRGANPNIPGIPSSVIPRLTSPILLAASARNLKLLQLLREFSKFELRYDQCDYTGATMLHYFFGSHEDNDWTAAAEMEQEEKDVLEMIIQAAPNLVNAEDQFSRRPLSWAVWNGELEAVKVLLKHGADVNDEDEYGRTALHCLAVRAACDETEDAIQKSVLETLLEAGADIMTCSKNGVSAFFEAVRVNSTTFLREFIKNLSQSPSGIDPEFWLRTDRYGQNFLHHAVLRNGKSIDADYIQVIESILEGLPEEVRRKCFSQEDSPDKFSPLHFRINPLDKYTPLQALVNAGSRRTELLQLFLKFGSDVDFNRTYSNGKTILQRIVRDIYIFQQYAPLPPRPDPKSIVPGSSNPPKAPVGPINIPELEGLLVNILQNFDMSEDYLSLDIIRAFAVYNSSEAVQKELTNRGLWPDFPDQYGWNVYDIARVPRIPGDGITYGRYSYVFDQPGDTTGINTSAPKPSRLLNRFQIEGAEIAEDGLTVINTCKLHQVPPQLKLAHVLIPETAIPENKFFVTTDYPVSILPRRFYMEVTFTPTAELPPETSRPRALIGLIPAPKDDIKWDDNAAEKLWDRRTGCSYPVDLEPDLVAGLGFEYGSLLRFATKNGKIISAPLGQDIRYMPVVSIPKGWKATINLGSKAFTCEEWDKPKEVIRASLSKLLASRTRTLPPVQPSGLPLLPSGNLLPPPTVPPIYRVSPPPKLRRPAPLTSADGSASLQSPRRRLPKAKIALPPKLAGFDCILQPQTPKASQPIKLNITPSGDPSKPSIPAEKTAAEPTDKSAVQNQTPSGTEGTSEKKD